MGGIGRDGVADLSRRGEERAERETETADREVGETRRFAKKDGVVQFMAREAPERRIVGEGLGADGIGKRAAEAQGVFGVRGVAQGVGNLRNGGGDLFKRARDIAEKRSGEFFARPAPACDEGGKELGGGDIFASQPCDQFALLIERKGLGGGVGRLDGETPGGIIDEIVQNRAHARVLPIGVGDVGRGGREAANAAIGVAIRFDCDADIVLDAHGKEGEAPACGGFVHRIEFCVNFATCIFIEKAAFFLRKIQKRERRSVGFYAFHDRVEVAGDGIVLRKCAARQADMFDFGVGERSDELRHARASAHFAGMIERIRDENCHENSVKALFFAV